MAKIVKVKMGAIITVLPENKIRVQRSPPLGYEKTKIIVIAMEVDGDIAGAIARNDGTVFRIGVVKNEDLATFTAIPGTEEIGQATATILGDVWFRQTIKITDPNKVNDILDKVQNSVALSLDEMKAIDPDNVEPGRIRSQSFTDKLTKNMGNIDGR